MENSLYSEYDLLEDKYWWFVGRRKIIRAVMSGFLDQRQQNKKILDIGCGTGGMFSVLKEFGEVSGMDMSLYAIKRAQEKTGIKVERGILSEKIPFPAKSFDVVTAFDLLEHIDDDLSALKSVSQLLKPKGLFIMTVPAYKFLWSEHDEINHHKRRYAKAEVKKKLCLSGFTVLKSSYFNLLLLPIIVLIRTWKKRRGAISGKSDFKRLPKTVNNFLQYVFSIERFGLRFFSYPAGTSIIAVAIKKE